MSWLDTVKKIAPTVAAALGGPLAGVAVTALGELFGMSDPTADKIKVAIENGSLTGEQISGIRQLELKLKDEEAERGFRYEELSFKNTADARKMRIETGSRFPEILSTLIVLGFFGILSWMMYDKAALDNQPLLVMLGSLGAAFGAVINYWLGNNKGSDRTKELLASSTPGNK